MAPSRTMTRMERSGSAQMVMYSTTRNWRPRQRRHVCYCVTSSSLITVPLLPTPRKIHIVSLMTSPEPLTVMGWLSASRRLKCHIHLAHARPQKSCRHHRQWSAEGCRQVLLPWWDHLTDAKIDDEIVARISKGSASFGRIQHRL